MAIWIFICPTVILGQNSNDVTSSLVKMGMEDIVVVDEPDGFFISYSDNVYRGTFRGAFEVFRLLVDDLQINKNIVIVLQENKVPRIAIKINEDYISTYHNKLLSIAGLMASANISYNTDEYNGLFRGLKRKNNSSGKVDIVLYPQLSLNNGWYDKIYGVTVNIAPALEVGLWKGASITGQVIFPVWNNLDGEVDYIRAGMLLFRQEYRFPKNIFMTFNIGNFNYNRMGADISFKYTQNNNRWETGVNAGITGSSIIFDGKWELSKWRKITGALFVRYNEPFYNLQFDLTGQRYVYGDYGVRFDCTRHFGEVSIGFYAMYTRDEPNGGFHFAVPLPRKKRALRKVIRLSAPEYYDMDYIARNAGEYQLKHLGYSYETRPDENRSQRYYNPDHIKSMLIKLASEK